MAAPDVELRLAIGREGLGLELGNDVSLGPLEVTELVVGLPNVRFPLDVSGGVAQFRHRRGELQRLTVELHAGRFRRWAAAELRGALGPGPVDVWIDLRRAGATIGVACGGEAATPALLAFEVTLAAAGEGLALVVGRARGSGLPSPPSALAQAAIEALLGRAGRASRRAGAAFQVDDAASRIVRALLPDAGARAPTTELVRWTALAAVRDAWILHASWGGAPAEATEEAARAAETAIVTREADEARARGDLEKARELDVAALERAPRHPEVCARIAAIDAAAGGRAEAALATLAEAAKTDLAPPWITAMLRGELLAEAGDRTSAVAAMAAAGEEEPFPALAARAFERAAELSGDDAEAALAWIDRALARAPATKRLRWARVAARLTLGRVEDALADVEHVEAQSSGARARFGVWARAGAAWQRAGFVAEAAALFERALRFVPDDRDSLAGLGRALLARGRVPRGVALLTRAIDVADRAHLHADDVQVDLARALAERLGDRPAAIARLRDVRPDAPEALEARALEGRYRAELGDLAGASLAFARMRERAETLGEAPATAREVVAAFLLEAAIFERETRRDALAAQRHLATALRLCPHDDAVSSAYRAVGAEIARRGREPLDAGSVAEAARAVPVGPVAPMAPVAPAATSVPHDAPTRVPDALPHPPFPVFSPEEFANMDEDGGGDEHDAAREARVEELTQALRARPDDDSVIDELADLLLALDRSHELLALLSARLEDAPEARRAELLPKQQAVLERLEADARAKGRDAEATLFAAARAALAGP